MDYLFIYTMSFFLIVFSLNSITPCAGPYDRSKDGVPTRNEYHDFLLIPIGAYAMSNGNS